MGKGECRLRMPVLQISTQPAKIAIRQTDGTIELAQPKADMSMAQPKAAMSMQTTKGKLTIDQSQAFEEANIMGPLRSTEKQAQAGKQAVLQGTQRRASQGSQLVDIHFGNSAIIEQAKQNGHRQYIEPSIKYIPSPFSVKTHYTKGKVAIDAQAQKPNIDVRINKPTLNFHRGGVNISMAQHPSLSIHFDDVYV